MENTSKTRASVASAIAIVAVLIAIAPLFAGCETSQSAIKNSNANATGMVEQEAADDSDVAYTSDDEIVATSFASIMNNSIFEVLYIDTEVTGNGLAASTREKTIIYYNRIDKHCYTGVFLTGKGGYAGYGGYDATMLTKEDGVTPMSYDEVKVAIAELGVNEVE